MPTNNGPSNPSTCSARPGTFGNHPLKSQWPSKRTHKDSRGGGESRVCSLPKSVGTRGSGPRSPGGPRSTDGPRSLGGSPRSLGGSPRSTRGVGRRRLVHQDTVHAAGSIVKRLTCILEDGPSCPFISSFLFSSRGWVTTVPLFLPSLCSIVVVLYLLVCASRVPTVHPINPSISPISP